MLKILKKNNEAYKNKSLNPKNFKRSEFVNNKSKEIKFNGNNYDLHFLDKETFDIYDLYENNNSKIKFFQDLTNLRIDWDKKNF